MGDDDHEVRDDQLRVSDSDTGGHTEHRTQQGDNSGSVFHYNCLPEQNGRHLDHGMFRRHKRLYRFSLPMKFGRHSFVNFDTSCSLCFLLKENCYPMSEENHDAFWYLFSAHFNLERLSLTNRQVLSISLTV